MPKRHTSAKALTVEVQMLSNPPTLPLLTVLVTEIRNTPAVFPQEAEIKRHKNAALAGSDVSKARSKVYWISVTGPHWRALRLLSHLT
jgi:hypothetical protein